MARSTRIDERNYLWESSDPTFMVVLFEGGARTVDGYPTSWSTDTYELTDCGVLGAIRWAQENLPAGAAWAVGLVEDRPGTGVNGGGRGFTFLEGYDVNASGKGLSDWEARQIDEMLARLDHTVVLPASSTTVWPNGSVATPLGGPSVSWSSD